MRLSGNMQRRGDFTLLARAALRASWRLGCCIAVDQRTAPMGGSRATAAMLKSSVAASQALRIAVVDAFYDVDELNPDRLLERCAP